FAHVDEGLRRVLGDGPRDSVAVYFGNPNAHNLSALLYGRVVLKALGSRNIYSASTVDQFPKQLASAYLFGTATTIAVPDLDRCEWLLVVGANPAASNGSLMTAPDARGRLQGIRSRGGRVVVVDPRRSRTAELADEHVAVIPGTDALLLFAMVGVLFDEGLVSVGRLGPHVAGVEAGGQLAGNPVVSTPNSARLAAALEHLDFMVSVDVYVNETTRFADVILPAPSPLERSHYDVALYGFAVRNVANYSPPAFASELPDEW